MSSKRPRDSSRKNCHLLLKILKKQSLVFHAGNTNGLLFKGITRCIMQHELFFFLKDTGTKATTPFKTKASFVTGFVFNMERILSSLYIFSKEFFRNPVSFAKVSNSYLVKSNIMLHLIPLKSWEPLSSISLLDNFH